MILGYLDRVGRVERAHGGTEGVEIADYCGGEVEGAFRGGEGFEESVGTSVGADAEGGWGGQRVS
jgi:hypothetical protein